MTVYQPRFTDADLERALRDCRAQIALARQRRVAATTAADKARHAAWEQSLVNRANSLVTLQVRRSAQRTGRVE